MTLSVSSISHRTSTKSLICMPSFHYHVIAEQEYSISRDLMSREEITEKIMAVYDDYRFRPLSKVASTQ